MTECRVCLSSFPENSLISPCKCRGTISAVHRDCLDNWLKEKYRRHFDIFKKRLRNGPTGFRCELCRHEYIGQYRIGTLFFVLKSIKNSKLTSSILINSIVIAVITYKLKQMVKSLPMICRSLHTALKSKFFKDFIIHLLEISGCSINILLYLLADLFMTFGTLKMIGVLYNSFFHLEIASVANTI